MRRLSEPPFNLDGANARAYRNDALRCACARGSGSVVTLLGQPPYSLGHDDAASFELNNFGSTGALVDACVNGNTHIVAMLGEPPYSLDQDDAMAFGGIAMHAAWHTSHRNRVVQALAKPPYLVRPRVQGIAEQQEALVHGDDGGDGFPGLERIVDASKSIWR